MSKKDNIEDKIKDLNEMRAVYHRDLEEFEKHKINYEKKKEKIRNKVKKLEEKLEKIRNKP